MAKVALITGGTGGIGKGTARVLLQRGWQVIATGATSDEVAAADKAENLSTRVLDVTDAQSVSAVVNNVSRMDALVNCAGIIRREDEFDPEVFQQVIAVNLIGTMRMCMAAYPLLRASSGCVVNIASVWSVFGSPLSPAYTASKGGVMQLTKSLAVRWAEDGIRVNAVAPGWIETPMTDGVRAVPAREEAILARTPMGRWGQPEEVGAAIAMLLSSDAEFVTGTMLPVDGGYSAS